MRFMMAIDLGRCVGCDTCTVACKQENGTPADVFFARVMNFEIGRWPDVTRSYVPVLCNHCQKAPCIQSCPNKAIFRRPDGIVIIDQERCKGTGACVSACPYGNIFLKEKDSWYLGEGAAAEEHSRGRLEPNAAARGVDVGFREEPAPGRHHKSERIGRQVQSELFSGRAGEVRIRYYP